VRLTSLLPQFSASAEGERLSKVTIRLFAEVVSPDNNDIMGEEVRVLSDKSDGTE